MLSGTGTTWGRVLFGLPISWFVQVITFLQGNKHCYRLLVLQNQPQIHTVEFLKDLVAFVSEGDSRVELLIVLHVVVQVLLFFLVGNAHATS